MVSDAPYWYPSWPGSSLVISSSSLRKIYRRRLSTFIVVPSNKRLIQKCTHTDISNTIWSRPTYGRLPYVITLLNSAQNEYYFCKANQIHVSLSIVVLHCLLTSLLRSNCDIFMHVVECTLHQLHLSPLQSAYIIDSEDLCFLAIHIPDSQWLESPICDQFRLS